MSDKSKLEQALCVAGFRKRMLTRDELSRPSNIHDVTPLVIEPESSSDDVSLEAFLAFLSDNKATLRETLSTYGAILFRGFHVDDSEAFSKASAAISEDLESEYLMGASPRGHVDGQKKVFHASYAGGEVPILPHNEMAYLRSRPQLILFQCSIPAKKYGETPIFDCRRACQSLNPTLKEELKTRGVRYLRHFPAVREPLQPDVLRTWKEAFEVETKEEVEAKCQELGIRFKWDGPKNDYLFTESDVSPVLSHPNTGEEVINIQVWNKHMWDLEIGNLAEQQDPELNEGLLKRIHIGYNIGWVPISTVWGDNGDPISEGATKQMRNAMWENSVLFRWQKGDMILLDNFSIGHGRMNFEGERLILASFGETITV